ncbi:MAG: hypothetical protein QGH90_00005, partial [Candidatus Poseidoniaceae archaeon]|nr:hypothetical protein [Candidatus Poseidoniaceae archaeon]
MRSPPLALLMVGLFVLAPLSGCFGGDEGVVHLTDELSFTPNVLDGGEFQGVTLQADADMAVFIPYLILNEVSGYVQNSTVVDLKAGQSIQLSLLAPPRTDTAVILVGEYGRSEWPIRDLNESWRTWVQRDGHEFADGNGISKVVGENGSISQITNSSNNGGSVDIILLKIHRQASKIWNDDLGQYIEQDGGRFANGLVNGMATYNYLDFLTDQSPAPLDLADG